MALGGRGLATEAETTSYLSPTPTVKIATEIDGWGYEVFKVPVGSKMSLVANFSLRDSVKEIVKQNHCKAAINGGFYDTNFKPLGWWTNSVETLRKPTINKLFDGFVSSLKNGKYTIARSAQADDLVYWGVQTGPIIRENSKIIKLSINNDKYARRMVAGVKNTGEMMWMAVYDNDSVFDGPKLAELPSVVDKIDKAENLQLVAAINMDGGTASAFISPEKKLYEFNPVGSMICLN
jgi:uncharacterized protein YigE (DUF2233 family)